MGSLSIVHWLVFIIVFGCGLVGSARILNRLGYNGAWAIFVFLVPLWMIGILILSFLRWPAENDRDR